MKEYKAETPFRAEGTFIYNLKQGIFNKRPIMTNDVYINVECRHLSEHVQKLIVNTIVSALNEEFYNTKG